MGGTYGPTGNFFGSMLGIIELILHVGHHVYGWPCVPKQPLKVCLDTSFVNDSAACAFGTFQGTHLLYFTVCFSEMLGFSEEKKKKSQKFDFRVKNLVF